MEHLISQIQEKVPQGDDIYNSAKSQFKNDLLEALTDGFSQIKIRRR